MSLEFFRRRIARAIAAGFMYWLSGRWPLERRRPPRRPWWARRRCCSGRRSPCRSRCCWRRSAAGWAIRVSQAEGYPCSATIDEFAGQWIAMLGLAAVTPIGLLAAFLLFRLLDVA